MDSSISVLNPQSSVPASRASDPGPAVPYAELHCLSNFTFLRGASHPEELVRRAAELGYAALAITDECSLAGVVRAHGAVKAVSRSEARGPRPGGCMSHDRKVAPTEQTGLKLIVGSELTLACGLKLVLLATDREGYGNLSALITRGRRRAEKGSYHLTREDLADGVPGCLVLWIPGRNSGLASAVSPSRPGGRSHGDLQESGVGDQGSTRFPQHAALSTQHSDLGPRTSDLITQYAVRSTQHVPLSTQHPTLGPRASDLGPDPAVRRTQHAARAPQHSTPNTQHPTLGPRTSDLGPDNAALSTQHRALGPRTSGLGPDPDALWLAETFPSRCWIAVELLREGDDAAWLEHCARLSARSGLPLTAAGDVHMHRRGRRALQDTLTAIRLRTTVAAAGRGLYANGERRLRPIGTLAGLYPAALLAESACIAARCDFSLDSLRYEYPGEIVPPGESPAAYLRRLTEEGARRRWPGGVPDRVRALIEHELELIGELAYEPYFLTVHDIVQFARARGILCQGRGSAANSAVCFCLGITEVDPARMDMLFERFISRERNEPPDIDVDFEHERREEVIQYIYRKYGRDRAALAATVISYRGRSAVRDVGKALGLSPGQVDRLARSLQWWDGGTIVPERLAEAGLDPDNPVIRRVVTLAHDLAGFPRHLSQHVGGFVVSRGPLSRLVPIENAAMAGRSVIQWDKDDLDALGLLKVDCLALGMLTAIHRALDLLRAHRGRDLTLATVPAEDPEVYAMIQRADTVGVFQIESRAQMAMLPRLRPACFYDLVIEVAIVRPGPIQGDMVHPYLRRRQGLEAVSYPNDAVRAVLERTLGVPIFQEQVIKLAMVAAGFSPGEADGLRRSMAAWKRNGSLGHYEQRLIEGMRERGYSEDYARRIFQQIQGFGEYGFPESHSASFALLVYVSAWLKRFEPAAFACALLNSQPMGFYAPDQLVQDARRHGVEVRGVDVRVSDWDCTLENSGEQRAASSEDAPATQHSLLGPRPSALGPAHAVRSTQYAVRAPQHSAPSTQHIPPGPRTSGLGPPLSLRLGLRLVKGLSHSGAQRLVAARAQAPFADVEDIARRARLDRRDLQALAAADALAGLSGNRHQAQWAVCGIEEPAPLFRNNEARGPRSEVRVADSKAARDTVRSTQYAVRATQHPTPSTQHSLLGPRTSDPGPDHAVHSTRYERRNPHSNAEACGSGLPTAISAASPSRPGGRSHSAECEHAPLGPRTSGLGPAIPLLRPPTEGENIVADYASLGLTLRRHPLAVIRDLLDRRGLLSAQAVWDTAHAETVRTAGLVVCRQCPSSSSGVIFATLEDETGNSQVIVWPRLAERQRRVLLTARLLGVTGTVQREGEVLHVIASGLQDYSGLLGRLVTRSRDFQ